MAGVVTQSSKKITGCFYCGSKKHKLHNCPKDWQQIQSIYGQLREGKSSWKKFLCDTNMTWASRINLYRIVLRCADDEISYHVKPVNINHHSSRSAIVKVLKVVHGFYRAMYLDKHQEKCPVCLEKFSKTLVPVRTKCGHDFCLSCYTTTVATSGRRASCPMCRKSLLR